MAEVIEHPYPMVVDALPKEQSTYDIDVIAEFFRNPIRLATVCDIITWNMSETIFGLIANAADSIISHFEHETIRRSMAQDVHD